MEIRSVTLNVSMEKSLKPGVPLREALRVPSVDPGPPPVTPHNMTHAPHPVQPPPVAKVPAPTSPPPSGDGMKVWKATRYDVENWTPFWMPGVGSATLYEGDTLFAFDKPDWKTPEVCDVSAFSLLFVYHSDCSNAY